MHRRAGSGCPISELAAGIRGFERKIDVFEDMARRNGDHAIGFDEIVAAFSVLLATERVDKTERRAQDARADGEARAVGEPITGRLVWIFRRECFFDF